MNTPSSHATPDTLTPTTERSFALVVAYDGTQYGGWQRQINSISIQQRIEEAVAAVSGTRVHVVGSGRTDAGVHAIGQIASMALPRWQSSAATLVPAINRWLPEDIVIRACYDAQHRFHAIRASTAKRYRYIVRVSKVPDPLQRRYHWWITRELDAARMREAAARLVGELDFASFQALGSPRHSTVRHVTELTLDVVPALDGYDLILEIQANGFLYNMVRRIVATLVQVGLGRMPLERFEEILAARNSRVLHHTAPAQGLYLLHVDYPDHCFTRSAAGR